MVVEGVALRGGVEGENLGRALAGVVARGGAEGENLGMVLEGVLDALPNSKPPSNQISPIKSFFYHRSPQPSQILSPSPPKSSPCSWSEWTAAPPEKTRSQQSGRRVFQRPRLAPLVSRRTQEMRSEDYRESYGSEVGIRGMRSEDLMIYCCRTLIDVDEKVGLQWRKRFRRRNFI
jgi:hypothetical protein